MLCNILNLNKCYICYLSMNEIYFQYFYKETDLNHLNKLLFKNITVYFL